MPLLDFLSRRLQLSRRKAKDLLDSRNEFVNERRIWMARHTLAAGDQVAALLSTPLAPGSAPAALPLLLADEHLLAIDKPAGLAANGPDSAESRLQAERADPAIRAVHRLDRDTSGCLLFARSAEAFDRMVALFREHAVSKIYQVLATGRLEGSDTIRRPLEGLPAVTSFAVLAANALASHLRVKIETGRTHQIRKHLSALGHPVVGDRSYGTARAVPEPLRAVSRQMLHAARISFRHPFTGEQVDVTAPLPRDFRAMLDRLRLR